MTEKREKLLRTTQRMMIRWIVGVGRKQSTESKVDAGADGVEHNEKEEEKGEEEEEEENAEEEHPKPADE